MTRLCPCITFLTSHEHKEVARRGSKEARRAIRRMKAGEERRREKRTCMRSSLGPPAYQTPSLEVFNSDWRALNVLHKQPKKSGFFAAISIFSCVLELLPLQPCISIWLFYTSLSKITVVMSFSSTTPLDTHASDNFSRGFILLVSPARSFSRASR